MRTIYNMNSEVGVDRYGTCILSAITARVDDHVTESSLLVFICGTHSFYELLCQEREPDEVAIAPVDERKFRRVKIVVKSHA